MKRTEWKQFHKKKGRLQRKRIREHNSQLESTQQPSAYNVINPKTRRESKI